MSNFSDLFGGGIKSIQRGVVTPTTTAETMVAITAVDPSRSNLTLLSSSGSSFALSGASKTTTTDVRVRLASATQIGVFSYTEVESFTIIYHACSWELVEYN